MATKTIENPFRPTHSESPPFLAGREEAQRKFQDALLCLHAGQSCGDIIISGATGMGRTALLNWIETEFSKKVKGGKKVRVRRVTPKQLVTKQDIKDHFLNDDWQKYFKAKGMFSSFMVLLDDPDEEVWFDFSMSRTLTEECKRSPLVMLMDDADGLDAKFCCSLLNLSQEISFDAPFAVFYAGLPGIKSQLIASGAGFIERATEFFIDRLDADEVKSAIMEPLMACGIGIEDKVLEHIVASSEGYPYFVQVWGATLWDISSADKHALTLEDIFVAKKQVDLIKDVFYEERLSMLKNADLLLPATIIANIFQNRDSFSLRSLESFVVDALLKDIRSRPLHPETMAKEMVAGLIEQQLIYQPSIIDPYQPLLPSMLGYILNSQREVQQKAYIGRINTDQH